MQPFLRYTLTLTIILKVFNVWAQEDSTQYKINERLKAIENDLKTNPNLKKEYVDLTFYYSQVFRNMADSQRTQGFKLSGYIDAYLAHYSDQLKVGEFQKFPTSSPISNAFSLNMAMVSASYQNEKARGVVTLHGGDIAACAWSSKYNFIQEANAGLKLFKNTWLDAGFFRTHLGFESIQPRENIGTSIALTTYYEPYYLSGAKLTHYLNKKISLQVSAFNGFNTYVAINKKKAFGFSAIYEPNSHLIATYNILISDNSSDTIQYNQQRIYQNFYIAFKTKRLNVGFEGNFGIQQNTGLVDSTKSAMMYSMLLAVKYKFKQGKYAAYGRVEVFNDKDEILTGPVINQYHTLVGLHAFGATVGMEYKPINNAFLRLESRYLHLWNNENIFYTNGTYTNVRLEVIGSLGVWF